jgi:hypothetical protein
MRMAILSVWWLLSSSALAHAQGHGHAETQVNADYEALIRDGVREYNLGNYAEARLMFSKAHALRPSARTLRGMGLSDFELKRYTLAIDELSAALDAKDRPLTGDHRALVTSALQRAQEYAARYTLVVPPGMTEIEVDGEARPLPASLELVLDPGQHHLAVQGPSGERIVRVLTADLGGRGRLSFMPESDESPLTAARNASGAANGVGVPAEGGGGRTFTWIAAGATGVFATGIVVFGLLAGDSHDEFRALDARCPGSDCDEDAIAAARDDGQRQQTLANVSIALAGIAAATAVTLFFLEPDDDGAGDEQLRVGVAPGVAVLSGRF